MKKIKYINVLVNVIENIQLLVHVKHILKHVKINLIINNNGIKFGNNIQIKLKIKIKLNRYQMEDKFLLIKFQQLIKKLNINIIQIKYFLK